MESIEDKLRPDITDLENKITQNRLRAKIVELEKESNRNRNAACHFRDTTDILDMLAGKISPNEKYPYTSLCIVESINSEGIAGRTSQRAGSTLKRLADVVGNKLLEPSKDWNPDKEILIDAERNYTLNSIGIWGWRTESNPRSLNGADFIHCMLYENKIPIEIIVVENCTDEETLQKLLTVGIEIELSSSTAFITYRTHYKTYRGIFYSEKNFGKTDGKKKIQIKDKNFQCFDVSIKDVIHVAGKMFYNRIYICANQDVVSRNIAASKNFLEEKWRRDNETKISAATKKIAELEKQIANKQNELETVSSQIEMQITDKKHELETISSQIEMQKVLLHDIANQVSKRIETARKNVVDFICETIFVNAQTGITEGISAQEVTQMSKYRCGKIIDSNESAEITNIKDFLLDVEAAIGCEGVAPDMMLSFTIYLCSAYRNKFPLLLAGPNARDIVDAFSVVLTGKTAAIFDCAGATFLEDLNACLESDDEVIAVLNPFSQNFIAYLPEIINLKTKFIFAIYPFIEDLRIEPRSFYNYFLPVLTELFIAKRSSRDFYSTKYNLNAGVKKLILEGYTPDNIPISASERIKKLIKDMQKIATEHFPENVDDLKKSAELFTRFPLAYVKGKGKNFLDEFKGDEKIGKKIRDFLEEVE